MKLKILLRSFLLTCLIYCVVSGTEDEDEDGNFPEEDMEEKDPSEEINPIQYRSKQTHGSKFSEIHTPSSNHYSDMPSNNEFLDILEKCCNVHPNEKEYCFRSRQKFSPCSNYSKTTVMFLFFLIFFLLFAMAIIFINEKANDKHVDNIKLVCQYIYEIPVKVFSREKDEKLEGPEICTVCTESYKEGDIIKMLPCNHNFHQICIYPWLADEFTCPICKTNIMKCYGFDIEKADPYEALRFYFG